MIIGVMASKQQTDKQMNNKSTLHSTLIVAMGLLTLTSCVDDKYNLDNISTEITLGAEGIEMPLGTINPITLDSLAGNEFKALTIGADGNYRLSYSDSFSYTMDAISIDPISSLAPAIEPYTFSLYDNNPLPADCTVSGFDDTFKYSVGDMMPVTTFEPIERHVQLMSTTGTIVPPAGQVLDMVKETTIPIKVSALLPDQIQSIEQIFFGDDSNGQLIAFTCNTGDLAPLIADGHLSMTLALPANYQLELKNNYSSCASLRQGTGSATNNIFELKNYACGTQSSIIIELYLKSYTVDQSLIANNRLTIDQTAQLDVDYKCTANGRSVTLADNIPCLTFYAAPKIYDVLFTTTQFNLTADEAVYRLDYKLTGLPSEIASIDYIALSEDRNRMHIKAVAPELPFVNADFVVDITLPDIFDFDSSCPYLNTSTNMLSIPISQLSAGLDLRAKGLVFTGNKGQVSQSGEFVLTEYIRVNSSHTFASTQCRLRDIEPLMDDQTVGLRVDDMQLGINPAGCRITLNAITENIALEDRFNYISTLPKEIQSIDYVTVEANGGGAVTAELKVKIENSPVRNLRLENIALSLPEILDISHANLDKDNRIVIPAIDIDTQAGEVSLIKLTLNGLKNVPVKERQLVIGQNMSLTATVTIASGEQLDGIDEQMVVYPTLTIDDMTITSITGKVDVKFDDYIEPIDIDLSELNDKLGDSNVDLDIANPHILVSITNPIGLAIASNITIQPYDKQSNRLEPLYVSGIDIAPATSSTAGITKLCLAGNADVAVAGYRTVVVSGLNQMLRKVPSRVVIGIAGGTDPAVAQTVVMGKAHVFDIAYDAVVPMIFGDQMRAEYTGVIDSLSGKFDDVADKSISIESLSLLVSAKTDIPLDIDLALEFLDADSLVLSDIRSTVDGKIAGYDSSVDTDGYRQSDLRVKVSLTDGQLSHLKNVDKIRYTLQVSSANASSALRPEQYVTATLQLIADKGITLDMKDIKTDNE